MFLFEVWKKVWDELECKFTQDQEWFRQVGILWGQVLMPRMPRMPRMPKVRTQRSSLGICLRPMVASNSTGRGDCASTIEHRASLSIRSKIKGLRMAWGWLRLQLISNTSRCCSDVVQLFFAHAGGTGVWNVQKLPLLITITSQVVCDRWFGPRPFSHLRSCARLICLRSPRSVDHGLWCQTATLR